MGKSKKKQEKPKNPISNFKPKNERRLVGHVNGKPLYSINGMAPRVVTDEMKNPKLRSLNFRLSALKGK